MDIQNVVAGEFLAAGTLIVFEERDGHRIAMVAGDKTPEGITLVSVGEGVLAPILTNGFIASDGWRSGLDERQQKEVYLAQVYASSFAHGTNGHNQYMLIAKLAGMLDEQDIAK